MVDSSVNNTKLVQKLTLDSFNKLWSPKLTFLTEKKICWFWEFKIYWIFEKFSLEHVDSWPKILLFPQPTLRTDIKCWLGSYFWTGIFIVSNKWLLTKYLITYLTFTYIFQLPNCFLYSSIQLSHMPHLNTRGAYFESLLRG